MEKELSHTCVGVAQFFIKQTLSYLSNHINHIIIGDGSLNELDAEQNVITTACYHHNKHSNKVSICEKSN